MNFRYCLSRVYFYVWLEKPLPTLYNEFTKEIIYYGKDNTVIIVVVYYEEKAWDGARTLHEMLDMCIVFEETRMEGQRDGLTEGIIGTGFELGMSENDILEQLQKKLDVPIQTAMKYLKRELGLPKGRICIMMR